MQRQSNSWGSRWVDLSYDSVSGKREGTSLSVSWFDAVWFISEATSRIDPLKGGE